MWRWGLEYKLSWGGGGEEERDSRLSGGSGESGERASLQPEHAMKTEQRVMYEVFSWK